MSSPPNHSEGKWTPKRQGEGVYSLREGDSFDGKQSDFDGLEGKKRQGSVVFWALGVLTLFVVVFMTVWLFKKQAGLRDAAERMVTDPSRVLQVSDEVIAGVSAKDWKGALPLEAAEGFVHAKTTAERLQFVRNPEANAKILAEFFENGPGSREKLSALGLIRSVTTPEMTMEEFQVDFVEGSPRKLSVVLENDTAKVDFKSYARYGSVDFSQLLDGSATKADEVRLIVSARNPYYNFAFSDERQWLSFNSQSPDLPANLLLYTRIGSDVERKMISATRHGSATITLSLESREDSHKNRQFEVTKFIAPTWEEHPTTRMKNAE